MKIPLTLQSRGALSTVSDESRHDLELPIDGDAVDEATVRNAMSVVIDPCSRFNGSFLSLIELGMIRDVRVDETSIFVALLLDDPSCVYVGQIAHELQQALERLPGGRSIHFSMVDNDVWMPELMTGRALERQKMLAGQLTRSVCVNGLSPSEQSDGVPDSQPDRG